MSRLVDVISDLVVGFDHQFANGPSHGWAAAWACFFSGRCMACPQCRFLFVMERREKCNCLQIWMGFFFSAATVLY